MIILATILATGSLLAVLFPVKGRFAAALILATSSFVLIPADLFEVGILSSLSSVLSGLLFLFLAVVTSSRPVRVTGNATTLIGIVVIGEISAMISIRPNLFAMAVALTAPAVFLVASSLSTRERSAVLTAVVGLAAFETLMCTYEAFYIRQPLLTEVAYESNPLFTGSIRGQGTLGHPLVAALVMLVGIGCTFALRWPVWVKVPIIVLLSLGVFSTGSSSAVVVSAFCVVAAFLVTGGARGRSLKISLVVIAGIVIASVSEFLTQSISSDISGVNLVHRTNSLIAVPRLITDRSFFEALFGSGWGSAESLYRRDVLINDGFYAIDNQFTTIMAVSGVLGAALFVGLLVSIVIKVRGPLRVALLSILIMSLSFDVLSWVATSSLFWIVVACALAELEGPVLEQRPSRALRVGQVVPTSVAPTAANLSLS